MHKKNNSKDCDNRDNNYNNNNNNNNNNNYIALLINAISMAFLIHINEREISQCLSHSKIVIAVEG